MIFHLYFYDMKGCCYKHNILGMNMIHLHKSIEWSRYNLR